MENQDNNINNDNNISNDSQLNGENDNKQQNKKSKWVNKNHFNVVGCYNSGNIFLYSFI